MIRSWMAIGGVVLAAAACAGGSDAGAEPGGEMAAGAAVDMEQTANMDQAALQCRPAAQQMPVEGRESPYDSVTVSLDGAQAKVCYGRPSVKGRTVFGELVPYDTLWRTGANEPTTIHLPVAAQIAGIAVEPGSYALYTVPGREEWTVIVNRSTSQWGHEGQYTPEVRSQEVGRATVAAEHVGTPVEQFTILSEPNGADGATLVLEWENTRVRIPIERS